MEIKLLGECQIASRVDICVTQTPEFTEKEGIVFFAVFFELALASIKIRRHEIDDRSSFLNLRLNKRPSSHGGSWTSSDEFFMHFTLHEEEFPVKCFEWNANR